MTSLGHTPKIPSRNRTILAGLIRDLKNPMATRFELRACNPYTNTYLVLAAAYSAILDDIRATVDRSSIDLLTEPSKKDDGTVSIRKNHALIAGHWDASCRPKNCPCKQTAANSS